MIQDEGLAYRGERSVLTAAKDRIEKIYKANEVVYVSYSGGKDSICLANVIIEAGEERGLDLKKTIWIFVDEEAIYPSVEDVVIRFRKRVLMGGMKFLWFCLPFKHFNCFNELYNDESFICWDPRAKENWIRNRPDFSITYHEMFKPGQNYQRFFDSILKNGANVIGLRANESIQRRKAITAMGDNSSKSYPIYDWTDGDVWKYIKERNLDFPEVYEYLYKTGTSRNKLRISQFFSIDTARSLVSMSEYYPDLFELILKREPNAYLAMMYWDTEMFRRNTKIGKELSGGTGEEKDFRVLSLNNLSNIVRVNDPLLYRRIMRLINKYSSRFTKQTWKKIYGITLAGDPKGREVRSLYGTLEK